jgi:cytochrome oxidase Cu insertion factor (SCO1/SenC/PrrC family)
MPSGLGFNWPGHSAGSAYRLLTNVAVGPGAAGLTFAAQTALRRLASAARVALATPSSARPSATIAAARSDARIVIIAAVVVALAVALAILLAIRRRRRTRQEILSEPSVANPRASPIRPRLAVPGLAVLCGVAVAVPVVALSRFRRAGAASGAPSGSLITPPPFSWPAGRRPAPEFVLRDQDGRRVSVGSYRGRALIITFVDPLCRNLCPLEAKLLNYVVGQMPAAKRPEILAVSVDVYANARTNLLQDDRKWALVPQWRWVVGRPAQLSAVWKQYKIGVSVTTKKIAGTTINYIIHTEAAYIIDATGHERALFLWPFYPQDVERTLRQLS